MRQRIKGIYLVLSSLLIALVQLPFAFAKSAGSGFRPNSKPSKDSVKAEPAATPLKTKKSVYDSLHLDTRGLSREAFEYATVGYEKLKANNRLNNSSIITVIDFSK